MNLQKVLLTITLGICSVFYFDSLFAQVRLPMLVSDSMVVQRDTKLKIWGWAAKDEKVTVRFGGRNYKTTADADGKWLIWLTPVKAGGPYEMEITASNKIILKKHLKSTFLINK